jgi:hypothetical protein
LIDLNDRLYVRFNEDKRDYRPAKYVQIRYENGTVFSVDQRDSGDVDVDLGPKESWWKDRQKILENWT